MITRIEIDGFKSFKDFVMEFTPFTVLAGANGSGKSNLFDALQLLSRLAEMELKTAFGGLRGEGYELFTKYDDETSAKEMSFAVEMLVDKRVKDNWGGEIMLENTRMRYELKLALRINNKL
ncbi:MAG: AAA family ATPase, partial [Tannerellaceae bacterium]|nr:AAA family ATPase [Tannerellaceae bacterium]